MPRTLLTCALLTLLTAAAARSLPDPLYPQLGQPGLNVLHYDLNLTVPRPGTPNLNATVTLTLRAELDLTEVQLDYAGPPVQAVTWDGQPVPFRVQRHPDKLIVLRPLRRGQQGQLSIRSAGESGGHPDTTLPISVGWISVPATSEQPGANFTFSEPDGAHHFMPCNDHPSDPATFTTRLTVPAGVTAVASGALLNDRPNGDGTHTATYDLSTPVPTYALGIHIGTLDEVRSADLTLAGRTITRRDYFPSSVPDGVRAPYPRTNAMLRTLSDWFGPYPFTTASAVVVTPALPALETAALLTMPVRSSRERVLVHELAHQWFGNAIPLASWRDTWLNEGFATYAELLWAEADGQDPQVILSGWQARLQGGSRPLVATTPAQLFDDSAYVRGALALHALRQAAGDPAFRTFLQTYARGRAGRPTGTEDLLALARQSLGPLAAETLQRWIEQPDLPPIP